MGFTFDAPISFSSAYDKVHRRKSAPSPRPSSKSRITSNLPFSKLTRRISNRAPASATLKSGIKPTSAASSLFFRLPLPLRQKIYGYVVGQQEVLHILLRRQVSYRSHGYRLAYRRCRAQGHVEDCVVSRCREFLDIADGTYFGSFDRIGGLFLACRDMYEEASAILYRQNVFDFDQPLSFLIFSSQVSQHSLHNIHSISFEPQRHLYIQNATPTRTRSQSIGPDGGKHTHSPTDQWARMWSIIVAMQALEEIRVKFRGPILGWEAKDVIEPLVRVERVFRVFEVEAPWISEELDLKADRAGEKLPFRLVEKLSGMMQVGSDRMSMMII